MVSINRVIASPVAKVQPGNLQKIVKKAVPAAGGLAVLAGAGMSNPNDLSHISVAPLPEGADVYNDPILDQLSYRASQISDNCANVIDGVSEVAHGAAHIVSATGDAVLDGAEFVADCAMATYTKAIVTIVDLMG